jgi:hypothetical protein
LASTERWNVTSTVVTVGEERAGPAADDERDRLVDLRSERIGGYILAVGVFAGIGLAMVRADRFWIAQALIAALVIAEITSGVVKLVLYRRGA